MRDLNRLVLAEDNRELAHGLREVLETVGGYEVWITWLVYDVISLLKRTEAAWLVLDLQLEDGYSGRLVPEIRRLWGDEVYIIVLSGLFDRYPEHELLGFGADNFLRKPYSPKSFVSQILRTKARLAGEALHGCDDLVLRVGDALMDLGRGTYQTQDGEEIFLSDAQLKLIRLLASARDEHGWRPVERGELMVHMWADEYAYDSYTYSNRLRQLKARTKRLLGLDLFEIHKGGHTSKWRLDPAVVELA